MKKIRARLTFTEEVLGTSSNNPEIHAEYIASKAKDRKLSGDSSIDPANDPDALILEEMESLTITEEVEKGMTVFPRAENGQPFLWDYQIKGFLKDAAQMLKKVPGTHCSGVKAFKKEIDGLLFTAPRKIMLELPPMEEIGRCQRPLRAQTPMGERIALADSETVPAGSTCVVEFVCLTDSMEKLVRECLDYGCLRGIGQWRNSGKGRFDWEEIG